MGLSFHLLWESSRGRSEQLSRPLLKAGVVVHPPCAPLILYSWGRGLDLALSTFPPFLCGRGGGSLTQRPEDAAEPPPGPGTSSCACPQAGGESQSWGTAQGSFQPRP